MRLKLAGVAMAVTAMLGGTMAPASAATHPCDGAFSDPTLAAACGLAIDLFCDVYTPPHDWCAH